MHEKYRVSLEVAKKLKEAGFPQDDCDAYWLEYMNHKGLSDKYPTEFKPIITPRKKANFRNGKLENSGICMFYAAPCVGRLGEELPNNFSSGRYCSCLNNVQWECALQNESFVRADTEAESRGLMWIQLRGEGLL